tara:strand:+ start:3264 stop:3560 length:297 start_codon:yes stop_codon:yes gene_type:complete
MNDNPIVLVILVISIIFVSIRKFKKYKQSNKEYQSWVIPLKGDIFKLSPGTVDTRSRPIGGYHVEILEVITDFDPDRLLLVRVKILITQEITNINIKY